MEYLGLFKVAKFAYNIHRIATESNRQIQRQAAEAANELALHIRELDQQVQSMEVDAADEDFRALAEFVLHDYLHSPGGSAVITMVPARFVTDQTGTQLGLTLFVAMHTMFRAGMVSWADYSESREFGPAYAKYGTPVSIYIALNLGKLSNYAFKAGRRSKQYSDYLHRFTGAICTLSFLYGIGAGRRLAAVDNMVPGEWAREQLRNWGV